MRTIVRRAWHLIRRRRLERDLVEEMEFHRAMKERALREGGLDPAEAALAARRALGNVLVAQDESRDVWIWPLLQGVWQDLRFAIRLLLKDRTFTTAAVLTLALGIGANGTIFSAVYAILLKPLPYADADRLVAIWKKNPPRGWVRNPISAAEFLAWRAQSQAFDDMAAFRPMSCVLSGASGAEEDPCEMVSSNMFGLLGVTPVRGRTFSADEDNARKSRVTILSDALWRRRFGGDPSAVGRAITVNGLDYTIVGVMPASFSHSYATPYVPVSQLWLAGIALSPSSTWNDYMAIGRLRPEIGLRQAEAATNPVSVGLEQSYSDLKGWRLELRTVREMNSSDTTAALLVLLGAVTFVLLIACANLANLLLARGTGRAHEFALRSALGAGRWRLIRQLLTESFLISLTGGILGLFLAWWGIRAFTTLSPESLIRAAPGLERAPLDLRVLAVMLTVSLVTTLLFGLGPAVQGAKAQVAEMLKETSRGSWHPRMGRFRSVLVISQVALAMALFVGAGLMIRTLAGLRGVNLGIDTRRVLTLRVPLAGERYKDPHTSVAFWSELIESVRVLPGVESASVSRGVPVGDWAGVSFWTADHPNPPAGQVPDANYVVVGPDYFTALRIPLKEGRAFNERDTQHTDRVAIVNEELARQHWPGQNPIGKRLRMEPPTTPAPWLSVVGVAGNVLSRGVDAGFQAEIYVPYQQYPWTLSPQTLIVRTTAGITPARVTGAIVHELQRLDKDQPATDIRTLEQVATEPMAQQRMVTALLGAFAGLALVLAALGIYGVLSYSVAQRRREIGVRVALGAHPGRMLQLVIGDGGRLAAVGIAAGTGVALALTRLLTDLLYGVRPTDVPTFVTATVVLAVASLLACYIPARRAMRVDPIEVLRQD